MTAKTIVRNMRIVAPPETTERSKEIKEFEEAKRREIAADAPREVDTTIPGWVCHFYMRPLTSRR